MNALLFLFKAFFFNYVFQLFFTLNFIWVIKSRRIKWSGHVAHMGEKRNACRVLVGQPEGRPCSRLNDNSKVDLKNRMGGHRLISPGSGHGNGRLL